MRYLIPFFFALAPLASAQHPLNPSELQETQQFKAQLDENLAKASIILVRHEAYGLVNEAIQRRLSAQDAAELKAILLSGRAVKERLGIMARPGVLTHLDFFDTEENYKAQKPFASLYYTTLVSLPQSRLIELSNEDMKRAYQIIRHDYKSQ